MSPPPRNPFADVLEEFDFAQRLSFSLTDERPLIAEASSIVIFRVTALDFINDEPVG